jgi:hypothetical protein
MTDSKEKSMDGQSQPNLTLVEDIWISLSSENSFGRASLQAIHPAPLMLPVGCLSQTFDTAGIYVQRGRFRQSLSQRERSKLKAFGITSTGQLLNTPQDFQLLTDPDRKYFVDASIRVAKDLVYSGYTQALKLIVDSGGLYPPVSPATQAVRDQLISDFLSALDPDVEACLRIALGLDNGHTLSPQQTAKKLVVPPDFVSTSFKQLYAFNTKEAGFDRFTGTLRGTIARDFAGITCLYDFEQKLKVLTGIASRGQTILPLPWLLDDETIKALYKLRDPYKKPIFNEFTTVYKLISTRSSHMPSEIVDIVQSALVKKGLAQPSLPDWEI